MTTYSKKYFNKTTGKWESLLATEARSAYDIAVENGYTGSEEEFNNALGNLGSIYINVDEYPTKDSDNFVYSRGVASALNDLKINIQNENYLKVVPDEFAKKDDVEQAISNNNLNYLDKEALTQSYQKLLSSKDVLFRLNDTPVLYGSTVTLDSEGDVVIEKDSDSITIFAYTSTEDDDITPPTGGSVVKVDDVYTILYPDGWYDSEWAQNELKTYPQKVIWYSYATFTVNEPNPIIDWTFPMYYAKNGEPGKDGSSIEFLYYLQPGKNKTWDNNVSKPSNIWPYNSPLEPWTESPTGVDVENQTEWVCIRIKAPGSDKWNVWQEPALWSVFGEDGKDGSGLEYIFKLTSGSTIPIEVTELEAVQEDDYVPIEWSDNILEVDSINNFLWCSIRRKTNGVWSKFEMPKCWGKYVTSGEPGKTGLIAYPAGIYDSSKAYSSDDKKTPYVYDPNTKNYYVINTANSTWNPNAGAPSTDTEELVWTKFAMFDAIYTKVGIVSNGLIGSAVFNGDYMFSQQGLLYIDGINVFSEDYEVFDISVVDDVFNGKEVVSAFVPNILFDLKTGRGWFGAGETLIYEDGSIVTRHITTIYEEFNMHEVDETSEDYNLVYVNSLNSIGSSSSCYTPFGRSFALRLNDTSINKAGVWYKGEILTKGCSDVEVFTVALDSKLFTHGIAYGTDNVPRTGDYYHYGIDRLHPFRFLFKWDGGYLNGVKTGEIVVISPYYVTDIIKNSKADTVEYDEDTVITEQLVSNSNKDLILVCPANCKITFNNSVYKLEGSVSSIQGTATQYKVYALHYVRTDVTLVNCSLYG